ncbi:hypothetical protein CCR75_008817 [Bremia lactucae]|uniref:Uncharacterized protein n=1 Tax=Bremia lactucae TaxID=4779 RepID=A0A976IDF8_BRELC|nr:hypothetical protein CCR75_008817 [Bremia lactucae]
MVRGRCPLWSALANKVVQSILDASRDMEAVGWDTFQHFSASSARVGTRHAASGRKVIALHRNMLCTCFGAHRRKKRTTLEKKTRSYPRQQTTKLLRRLAVGSSTRLSHLLQLDLISCSSKQNSSGCDATPSHARSLTSRTAALNMVQFELNLTAMHTFDLAAATTTAPLTVQAVFDQV